MNSILLRSVLLAAVLGSCVTLKTHEDTARKNVLERTAFDLDCEPDEIKVVRIGDIAEINANITRMAFGVTCMDKRASYMVTCTNNLNSVSCSPELNSVRSPNQ